MYVHLDRRIPDLRHDHVRHVDFRDVDRPFDYLHHDFLRVLDFPMWAAR